MKPVTKNNPQIVLQNKLVQDIVEVAVDRAKEEIKINGHLLRQLQAFGVQQGSRDVPLDFYEELLKAYDEDFDFEFKDDDYQFKAVIY